MTNPDYTAHLLIVDRSGSMVSIKTDMEGGIKELLKSQDELPGKYTVDIAYFDSEFKYPTKQALAASASVNIEPRGLTALHDAIGLASKEFGASLADMPEDERPGKVLVTVITDGGENASREFTGESVKELIQKQKDEFNWEFTFLGANQDAALVGNSLGINHNVTYQATAAGVAASMDSMQDFTRSYRTTGSASF
jgi:hypothetical protein